MYYFCYMIDKYLTNTATISADVCDDTRRIFGPNITALEGKTIWITVTGSSSRIGAELAIQLASAGVGHLILSGRRIDKLEKVAKSCNESHTMRSNALGNERKIGISLVPFDQGQVEELDGAVTSALEKAPESGIDIIILILNAGQYHLAPALELELETNVDKALPDLMQVNFASPVQLAHRLLRQDRCRWKERGYGQIVAVSSLMARGASPLNAAYSASKHALRSYFLALAVEENSWLRVDVVLPGPGVTDTGLWLWDASSSLIHLLLLTLRMTLPIQTSKSLCEYCEGIYCW